MDSGEEEGEGAGRSRNDLLIGEVKGGENS